jgi:hypothetical protein
MHLQDQAYVHHQDHLDLLVMYYSFVLAWHLENDIRIKDICRR